ncbi:MAG TPA: biotin/lipoyl-containing protein [Chthonomonadaceae bacterium]|nr:biotin/lipoyl-containing protein [Chthonomonadaceae bacterium]
MQLTFQYQDELITLQAEPEGEGWRVRLPDGTEHILVAVRLPGEVMQITLPGSDADVACSFRAPFARTERGIEIAMDGETYLFTPTTGQRASRKRTASSGALTAPMVGVVAEVLVTEGQTVEAYQPLAVVEAMKVMATIEAPFAGIVEKVYVRKSERVAHGAPIVDIRAETPTLTS